MMATTDRTQARKIDDIRPISSKSDDLFITCASFEERCLGSAQRLVDYCSRSIVVYKFTEPNSKRELLFKQMLVHLESKKANNLLQINVSHSKTSKGVLELHHLCQENDLCEGNLNLTIDITTFTKSLLLELLFYVKTFLNVDSLRFVYTLPKEYAHPEEGELSFGIKSCNILPSFWGGWSPIKDDLLAIILGYEEMRAWSLINHFDANVNWLFTTNPGSKPEWSKTSEKYNERLLKEVHCKDSIPALDVLKTNETLEKYITKEVNDKYNVFISPMGPKPQTVGLFYFIITHPKMPLNIVTTTAIEHNIPYYSWGIGDTYEFYLPTLPSTKHSAQDS
jgi:hypothetical protein